LGEFWAIFLKTIAPKSFGQHFPEKSGQSLKISPKMAKFSSNLVPLAKNYFSYVEKVVVIFTAQIFYIKTVGFHFCLQHQRCAVAL
jgi:hypothetical protein